MLVGWGEGELGSGRGGAEAVEAVLEDGIDVAVGAGAGGQGARTRRFQARGAIPLAQAEQPEAGAEALLGMRAIGEDGDDQGCRLGPDVLSPAGDARGRLLQVAQVGLGHMGGDRGVVAAMRAARVGGDALAAGEDLHRAEGAAEVDALVDLTPATPQAKRLSARMAMGLSVPT